MGDRDSGVALAELVGAFSLATDLGLGQPMEHVLRSWVIAARLGEHIGLEVDDRDALYYVATLAWVGCVADSHEMAHWFGDDLRVRSESYGVNKAGLPKMRFILAQIAAGALPYQRITMVGRFLAGLSPRRHRRLVLPRARQRRDHCHPLSRIGVDFPTPVGDGSLIGRR